MNVGEALEKPIGPLPAGAWVVVVAGGLLIGRYVRNRSAGEAAPVGTDTAFGTVPTVGNLGGSGGASSVGQGALATSPLIDTNEKWRQVAITNLLGRGFNPALVDTAIGKYFAGEPLTTAEQAVIEAAYLYLGPTPQIVPPVVSAPPTTTPDPTPTPSPVTLPGVNSGDFPLVGSGGEEFIVLGTVTNGVYHGYNVGGGVPVYALINGQWRQNWGTFADLPSGTPLGIPALFEPYIAFGAGPV